MFHTSPIIFIDNIDQKLWACDPLFNSKYSVNQKGVCMHLVKEKRGMYATFSHLSLSNNKLNKHIIVVCNLLWKHKLS